MSNSRRRPSRKKKAAISQKNLIIAAAAVVVMVLVIVLIVALSGSKGSAGNGAANATPTPTPQGPAAADLVAAAPGKMTILCDIELTLGYDATGKVIALTGNSEVARAVAGECQIAGMSCKDAMAVIIPAVAGERTLTRKHITIRQEQGTVDPGAGFMKAVGEAAQAATEIPVISIGFADMDENGYFGTELAERSIRAALGNEAEITHMTGMYEGRYVATVQLAGVSADYFVSALTGTVTACEDDSIDEPYDESFHEGMGNATDDNPNVDEETPDEEEKKEETPTEEQTPVEEEKKEENAA